MQTAFIIFKYFSRGGAQRDMASAARALLQRGVGVTVLCSEAADPLPEGCGVELFASTAHTNHAAMQDFERQVKKYLQSHHFDAVIGFSRIGGLDIYFAADDCLLRRWKNSLLNRLLPRRRSFLALEASALKSPVIFTLTARQEQDYQRYYQIATDHFTRVPPGIDSKYRKGAFSIDQRKTVRQSWQIPEDALLIVQTASSFMTKGVDRSMAILNALDSKLKKKLVFIVTGDDKRREKFSRLAACCKLDGRFPGGSDRLEELFRAADLMLHPAREESAGNVLIEALTSNLPILTTNRCGYAEYITASGGGVVLPEPFNLDHWVLALKKLLTEPEHLIQCRKNTHDLYKSDFWYSRGDVIADGIIKYIRSKKA